jgi:hypothetical protein
VLSDSCERSGELGFERAYPPPDVESEIVPVRYTELTDPERSLVDAGIPDGSVEVCMSDDSERSSAFRQFVERVRASLSEQGSISGGAPHVYLLRDGEYYDVRVESGGTTIAYG